MTLTGTHPSPHSGVTTWPTITERGTGLDSLGSTTTMLGSAHQCETGSVADSLCVF